MVMLLLIISLLSAAGLPVSRAARASAESWQGAFAPHFTTDGLPDVRAGSFALMDRRSRVFLLGRNIEQIRHPASLTKLMTLLLAHELGRQEEWVTISRRAALAPGSRMGVRYGEKWKLSDLMLGAALPSGNDAAVALAEHLAGSVEDFARLMNDRAQQLDMHSSSFRNPHGLTHPEHVSTAHDMARLAAAVMQISRLRGMVSLREEEVTSLAGRSITLRNTNRLLREGIVYRGVKTGTTHAAGECLIAAKRRGRAELIAVVLKSPDRWGDARRALIWGFDSFLPQVLAKPDAPLASVREANSPWLHGLYVKREVVVPLPRGAADTLVTKRVNRPGLVSTGAKGPLGELVVEYSGEVIYRADLYRR